MVVGPSHYVNLTSIIPVPYTMTEGGAHWIRGQMNPTTGLVR